MNISKILLTNIVALTAPIIYASPAGILPICKDKQGTVRVLLSREAQGRAAGTWCDLGGKSERGETPWQTACREAAEESCGYFRPHGTRRHALQASIAHMHTKKNKRIGCLTDGTYHMFIAPFRYFDNETQRVLNGGYAHREKNKFRWVSFPGLIRDIEQGHHYYTCKNGEKLPLRDNFFNLCARNLGGLKQILRQAKRTLNQAR